MRITVVTNRNAIMLAIAFGIADAGKVDAVATAVHGDDHFIYPDCRPGFIDAFQRMQDQALEGYANNRLYAPYLTVLRAQIVKDGAPQHAFRADMVLLQGRTKSPAGSC